MSFFSNLFKEKKGKEAEILNAGLKYAMEFGENFLQPIQKRLSKKFPNLNARDLDSYDKICREAMRAGHDLIYTNLASLNDKNEKITAGELSKSLRAFLKEKYNWVNESNSARLLSQGLYYAWKDGLDSCVV